MTCSLTSGLRWGYCICQLTSFLSACHADNFQYMVESLRYSLSSGRMKSYVSYSVWTRFSFSPQIGMVDCFWCINSIPVHPRCKAYFLPFSQVIFFFQILLISRAITTYLVVTIIENLLQWQCLWERNVLNIL